MTLSPPIRQALVAVGVLGVAAGLAVGALEIPSTSGYAGVGPNFLPWVVAAALAVCGLLLLREVRGGGFRDMEAPSGAEHGDWRALALVSAGVLLNAMLITRIGFVLSCALCFALAVRGLRSSEGRPGGGARAALVDLGVGLAIAWPVYLLFTKLLAIGLPGLLGNGWL